MMGSIHCVIFAQRGRCNMRFNAANSLNVVWLSDTIRVSDPAHRYFRWWCHLMETFSALLAICAGNALVPDEFPAQRPVTRSFDIFFDVRPNKRLSKQLRLVIWDAVARIIIIIVRYHKNVASNNADSSSMMPLGTYYKELAIETKVFIGKCI